MGIDRNNNINNENSSSDNNVQQSTNQTSPIKNQSGIKNPDNNNDNNNSTDRIVNGSHRNPSPTIESANNYNDSTQTSNNDNNNQADASKTNNKIAGQHFGFAGKAKHLKLNTLKAFQQQQQQQTQHNVSGVSSKGNQKLNGHQHHVSNPEYLAQLLKDKRQLLGFPALFTHVNRILDNEINRVRVTLLHQNPSEQRMQLPDPEGELVVLSKKLYVPQKEYPEFNFVGRILGPRGMTAKQLELDTGCKIMIRGKGSMRDKAKEDTFRGKPNWEHLDEDLQVLISVEDTENRASVKLARAMDDVQKLLVPSAEGEDSLKKLQLMELAIINGTYRDLSRPSHLQDHLTQMIPLAVHPHPSGGDLNSPHVCMAGPALLPSVTQPPPATPTLVTTPVLLTPRISPYFPPPGTLTRTTLVNPRQQHPQQQVGSGLVFQIDPNYVAVHHSPFLEFALYGSNNQQQQQQQESD